ncbi:MAG: cytochrome o ubiquinol oxidase subunit IV [Sphingomonas sp.]|jgi:cytochrome o ubiquinol oxidase operon protein cyoD|nr:MAG: cytochrome o ubiquinol oxidase subunit IV [Sphingomonas sp.]
MSDSRIDEQGTGNDKAPGEEDEGESIGSSVRGYCYGLGLAAFLTVASFWALGTDLIYGPGIPVALIALAVAQMGVHLVFFLHVTSGPDNTNNVMALAFGVLIVALVLVGSLWIMNHLHHNLMPMSAMADMQR